MKTARIPNASDIVIITKFFTFNSINIIYFLYICTNINTQNMLSIKSIEKFDNEHVIDMYNNGMTLSEIAKKLGTGYNQLHQYFIIKNAPTRKAKRRVSIRNTAPKGQKFGLWTVVSDEVKSGKELSSDKKSRSLYWLVRCKCGHLSWKNSAHLKDGTSTRCKCCGNKNYISKDGSININALIASKYNQIKMGLKTRKKMTNMEFSLLPEDINELYNENHYCALSGIDLSIDLSKTLQQQNLSVDRIDSNLGYTKDNIQLVDKRINMMKGTLSNTEFIELCCKVAEHYGYSKCE